MTVKNTGLLQLHISLLEIEPLIWRRVIVPCQISFAELGNVLLTAMGWDCCHLYEFRVGAHIISDPENNDGDDDNFHDQHTTLLHQVIGSRQKKFKLWYDFGDDWWHDIKIEKHLPDDGLGARLLAGENACPPEDCGGVPGYYRLLEIMADKKHPEYQEMREWLGETFDPATFNLEQTRKAVAAILQP
jgi:hypothetical protein